MHILCVSFALCPLVTLSQWAVLGGDWETAEREAGDLFPPMPSYWARVVAVAMSPEL